VSYRRDESIGYLINSVGSKIANGLKQLFDKHALALSPQEWGIIAAIAENNELSQMEISHLCFYDKVKVTRIIDDLEKRQIVERRQDPADRRSNRIVLLPKGQAIYQQVVPIVSVYLKQLTKPLSPDELVELKTKLRKLDCHLDEII
jgi:DNA-binding MarR family transcriptional regulator